MFVQVDAFQDAVLIISYVLVVFWRALIGFFFLISNCDFINVYLKLAPFLLFFLNKYCQL